MEPSDIPNDIVEQAYTAYLNQLSSVERYKMIGEMTEFLIQTLRHEARLKNPEFTEEQVKIQAARSFYYDDPMMQKLLNVAWERTGG